MACRRGSSSSVDPAGEIMYSARGTECRMGPSFRAAKPLQSLSRDVPEWQSRARGLESPSLP
eukprot:2813903-Rhodomonas_salina.1